VPYGEPQEADWDDPLDAGVRGHIEHNDAVAAGLQSVSASGTGRGRFGRDVTHRWDRLARSGDDGDVAGDPGCRSCTEEAACPPRAAIGRPRTLEELGGDVTDLPLPDC
jgi:hypothetical protein